LAVGKTRAEGGGLGYLLITSAHAWRTSLGHRLGPLGLTPAQFFVLMAVHRRTRTGQPALSQRQIAQKTGMDVNVVSQVIRALERRGILERGPHPSDSRALTVTLSPSGSKLAIASSAIARRLNDEFFADADNQLLGQQLGMLTQPI
jgi:MarR family transcriptional regulator, organic hydroperoxide resistance regulator